MLRHPGQTYATTVILAPTKNLEADNACWVEHGGCDCSEIKIHSRCDKV